jgi:hypothetical protein
MLKVNFIEIGILLDFLLKPKFPYQNSFTEFSLLTLEEKHVFSTTLCD